MAALDVGPLHMVPGGNANLSGQQLLFMQDILRGMQTGDIAVVSQAMSAAVRSAVSIPDGFLVSVKQWMDSRQQAQEQQASWQPVLPPAFQGQGNMQWLPWQSQGSQMTLSQLSQTQSKVTASSAHTTRSQGSQPESPLAMGSPVIPIASKRPAEERASASGTSFRAEELPDSPLLPPPLSPSPASPRMPIGLAGASSSAPRSAVQDLGKGLRAQEELQPLTRRPLTKRPRLRSSYADAADPLPSDGLGQDLVPPSGTKPSRARAEPKADEVAEFLRGQEHSSASVHAVCAHFTPRPSADTILQICKRSTLFRIRDSGNKIFLKDQQRQELVKTLAQEVVRPIKSRLIDPAVAEEAVRAASDLALKAYPDDVMKLFREMANKTLEKIGPVPRDRYPANMPLMLACIIDRAVMLERQKNNRRGKFEKEFGPHIHQLIFRRWTLGVVPGSHFLANLLLTWQRLGYFKGHLDKPQKVLWLLVAYASAEGVSDPDGKEKGSGWYKLVLRDPAHAGGTEPLQPQGSRRSVVDRAAEEVLPPLRPPTPNLPSPEMSPDRERSPERAEPPDDPPGAPEPINLGSEAQELEAANSLVESTPPGAQPSEAQAPESQSDGNTAPAPEKVATGSSPSAPDHAPEKAPSPSPGSLKPSEGS